jgi:hypothetical protein
VKRLTPGDKLLLPLSISMLNLVTRIKVVSKRSHQSKVGMINSWISLITSMINSSHPENSLYIVSLLNIKWIKESNLEMLSTKLKREWWNLKLSEKKLLKRWRRSSNCARRTTKNWLTVSRRKRKILKCRSMVSRQRWLVELRNKFRWLKTYLLIRKT